MLTDNVLRTPYIFNYTSLLETARMQLPIPSLIFQIDCPNVFVQLECLPNRASVAVVLVLGDQHPRQSGAPAAVRPRPRARPRALGPGVRPGLDSRPLLAHRGRATGAQRVHHGRELRRQADCALRQTHLENCAHLEKR